VIAFSLLAKEIIASSLMPAGGQKMDEEEGSHQSCQDENAVPTADFASPPLSHLAVFSMYSLGKGFFIGCV